MLPSGSSSIFWLNFEKTDIVEVFDNTHINAHPCDKCLPKEIKVRIVLHTA